MSLTDFYGTSARGNEVTGGGGSMIDGGAGPGASLRTAERRAGPALGRYNVYPDVDNLMGEIRRYDLSCGILHGFS